MRKDLTATEIKEISRKKDKKTLIVIICVLLAVCFFFGGFAAGYFADNNLTNSLNWVTSMIDKNYCYYDEETGTYKKFTDEDYADAIVKTLLDKYSDYYTEQEFTDVVYTSLGNNYGTGIYFYRYSEDLSVFVVAGNSPAEKAGMEKGDVIVAGLNENGERINFADREELFAYINKFKEKEKFSLTIIRNGVEMSFFVQKEVYVESYVYYKDSEKTYVFRADDGKDPEPVELIGGMEELPLDTAFIRLEEFSGGAAEQFAYAMDYMKERGKTKLILDLRSNGGGQMDILTKIASYLVYSENDKRPVIAVSKNKRNVKTYFTASGDNFNRNIKKIVVLADGNTASASECLIGAMAYYKKAFTLDNLVITEHDGKYTTYGKGIMQTTYRNFVTGEGIKLTTDYIFQPDETTTIHGVGFIATEGNGVANESLSVPRALEILAQP